MVKIHPSGCRADKGETNRHCVQGKSLCFWSASAHPQHCETKRYDPHRAL
jgi:hypothetical protein